MNAWIVSTFALWFLAGTPAQETSAPSKELTEAMADWLQRGSSTPPEMLRNAPPDQLLQALPTAMPWSRSAEMPAAGKIQLEHTYYLYQLPEGYNTNRPWPLVLSFHGTPMRHCERVHRVYWKGDPAKHGYILVSPNLDHGQWHQIGDPPVQDVLLDIFKRFRIDQDRIYVDGYSSGGTASWVFGTRLADLVAGIVVRCGVRRIPDSQVANLVGRGVFLIHASADTKVNVSHARRVVPVMKRLGIHHIYVEHPGQHDFFPKDNEKVLEYFSKWVRPRPDNFAYYGPFFGLNRIVYFFNLRGSAHQVKGGFGKNQVWLEIDQEKKIKSLAIYFSREMVDFSKPITLNYNNTTYTLNLKPTTSAFLKAFALSPLYDPATPDRTFVAGVQVIEEGKLLAQPRPL